MSNNIIPIHVYVNKVNTIENNDNINSFENGNVIFCKENKGIYVKINDSIDRYGGNDIIDHLESSSTKNPLSANQGRILNLIKADKTETENIKSDLELTNDSLNELQNKLNLLLSSILMIPYEHDNESDVEPEYFNVTILNSVNNKIIMRSNKTASYFNINGTYIEGYKPYITYVRQDSSEDEKLEISILNSNEDRFVRRTNKTISHFDMDGNYVSVDDNKYVIYVREKNYSGEEFEFSILDSNEDKFISRTNRVVSTFDRYGNYTEGDGKYVIVV